MCDQSTACNPDWHKGTGRVPQRGCFGLHQILYSIHNTATDRRWERSQLIMPPAIKQAPLTTRSSSLRCVSAAEHHTAEQYSKTGKTKPQKASPNEQFIMEYPPGLPRDTKSLRSCSEDQAKMLLKGKLESNVTPNISRSSDSFSTVQELAKTTALRHSCHHVNQIAPTILHHE